MINHYGDKKNSVRIVLDRWRSRYLFGCGEYLRQNLFRLTIFDAIWELKIYLLVIAWWVLLILSMLLIQMSIKALVIFIISSTAFFAAFLIKKRRLDEFLFSLFSWNITALGLICGFLSGGGDPKSIIESIVIK
jgi:hypothetical protein